MLHPGHIDAERFPAKVLWFIAVAWVVILAKCVWVWWAVEHWRMPVHPLWVVGPTVACAALATSLWLAHKRE